MDQLPFVTEVYKRDLRIEDYFGGYLLHPYVSLYTGRGCKSRCTFCLWPQTVGGHRYRVRSPGHVIEEVRLLRSYFPQMKELFFDDDTFTDNAPRAETIARELGKMGVTWSCNAKANVPRATLKVCGKTGCGCCWWATRAATRRSCTTSRRACAIDVAQQFAKDCHELGIRDPRHLHRRPARRDEGDHRGDHPLRHRDQPAHPAGVAGRALSRHLPLPPGGRERLARRRARRTGGRARRPDRAAALSAPVATPRSSNRWRPSTAASISARRRSPRSSARW